jgi:hypothetical protein
MTHLRIFDGLVIPVILFRVKGYLVELIDIERQEGQVFDSADDISRVSADLRRCLQDDCTSCQSDELLLCRQYHESKDTSQHCKQFETRSQDFPADSG